MKIEIDSDDELWFHIFRSTVYAWEAEFGTIRPGMEICKAKKAGFIFRMKELSPEYAMPKLHHHQYRMNIWRIENEGKL